MNTLRIIILALCFPLFSHAATFTINAPTLGVGESGTVRVFVSPESETVYTAKLVLAIDDQVLGVSNIQSTSGWFMLSQPGYDSVSAGQLIKTGGYSGGISAQKEFLSFTVTRKSSNAGALVVSSESQILNKDGVNVHTGSAGAVFPQVVVVSAPVQRSLPQEFTMQEEEVIPDSTVEPAFAINTLPAAVITSESRIPWVPLMVVLFVLLAGVVTYTLIRLGRKIRG